MPFVRRSVYRFFEKENDTLLDAEKQIVKEDIEKEIEIDKEIE